MLGYLSADIIYSKQRTVFRERSSRKTVSYEKQILSKDKYLSIFSPQMEATVFIILQIFFATRAFLKIGEYPRIFPSFSWGIFAHVTRLDQSRASKNIWWIINTCMCAYRHTRIPKIRAYNTHMRSSNRSELHCTYIINRLVSEVPQTQ